MHHVSFMHYISISYWQHVLYLLYQEHHVKLIAKIGKRHCNVMDLSDVITFDLGSDFLPSLELSSYHLWSIRLCISSYMEP